MKSGTVIFIDKYGDFDIRYMYKTLIHPNILNVDSLKEEFCARQKINSFSGHSSDKADQLTEKFVDFLTRTYGFTVLKGTEVSFSD